MKKPIVFISHSLPQNDRTSKAAKVREALRQRLNEHWDVFIDVDRVQGGELWRPTILDHIHRAQAAVVLFDERAVKRDWVAAETLMFSFRKSISPTFHFIPVLFDNLQISNKCFDRYEPFGFQEIQAVAANKKNITTIVDEVANSFPEAHTQFAPQCEWIRKLLTFLKHVDIDGWISAANALGINCSNTERAKEDSRTLLSESTAQLMHHRHYRDTLRAAERLLDHIADQPDLRPTSAKCQEDLCKMMRAKWVPNESVATLLKASRDIEKKEAFAVTSANFSLLEEYLTRTRIEYHGRFVRISVSGSASEDHASNISSICDDIRECLFPIQLPRHDNRSTMTLEEAVQREQKRDPRLYAIILLPQEFNTPEIVSELRRRFPSILILLSHPTEKGTSPNGARLLLPHIDVHMENSYNDLYNHLISVCRQVN